MEQHLTTNRTTSHFFPWYKLALPFSERRIILLIGDLLSLLVAAVASLWGHAIVRDITFAERVTDMDSGTIIWLLILAAIWLILTAVNESYDLKTAADQVRTVRNVLTTAAGSGGIFLLFFFLFGRPAAFASPAAGQRYSLLGIPSPPRIIPLLFLVAGCVLVALWRVGYIRLFTSGFLRRRVLIVGAGNAGRTVVQAVRRPLPEYEIVGFVDDDPDKHDTTIDSIPLVGNRYDLPRLAQSLAINEIILAITHEIHPDLFKALLKCYECGITIKPMQLVYEELLGQIPVEHLGEKWFPVPLWSNGNDYTFYRLFKRLSDIIFSAIGLLLLLPIVPVLAIAVYLDSPGPLFYTQKRLGKRGTPFRLVKFRSMIPNAEKDGKAVWATSGDPRVTRIGKFLRRTRLDELPQLINVLKGEMSLIGPRPERPEFIEELQEEIPFYRARLSVKPGLTGWAQIKHPYGNTVDDARIKLQYDLYYIKNRSFMLDFLIMLRTIKVMLTFKGT